MVKKEKILLLFIFCFCVYILYLLLKPVLIEDNEIVLGISPFTLTVDNETGERIYSTGEAKVLISHPDENWRVEEIFNPDGNVVHKAAIGDIDNDGKNEMVVACGCKSLREVKEEKCPLNASVKVYKFKNGEWESQMIWSLGESVRVRDVEIGDIDNDGKNEIVIGTHAPGIVAILEYKDGEYVETEVDRIDEDFVHEIEIEDIDNDGINEFFVTFTLPNFEGKINPGLIKMYKWNGYGYDVMILESNDVTNAKEIALGDVDNDGNIEMIAIYSCVPKDAKDPSKGMLIPSNIKKFDFDDGNISNEVIYSLNHTNPSNCFITERSVDIGDIDDDGKNEIVIGTHTMGIYIIKKIQDEWKSTIIDKDPNAGIHALIIVDVDGDGNNEILSSSDGDNVVRMHKWNVEWISEVVFNTTKEDLTWAMDFGNVDND